MKAWYCKTQGSDLGEQALGALGGGLVVVGVDGELLGGGARVHDPVDRARRPAVHAHHPVIDEHLPQLPAQLLVQAVALAAGQ